MNAGATGFRTKPSVGSIDLREVGVTSAGVELLPPTTFVSAAGKATAVRGRNGAGKSTLLKVMCGQYAPSSGSAFVAGSDVRHPGRDFRRRVASMIGLPPMAPDLTVRDHVDLVAATWFSGMSQRAAVAAQVVEATGLAELEHRFPHELSSGQRQLFGLGLILARPYEVLILDEPEQRLDSEHVKRLSGILIALRNEGRTLIVATHSDALTEAFADQVLTLDPQR
ncbi:ABC transporter ATP-binding protein [Microbacterium rhizomatis]|uniref:ATP-binding cassette domain-containing protein n=1 Tax=Microbacterium rhizomatis TaxID=1631477 RepID=A0A5J5IWW3_9MICO|nr:ABC transporter ATP-binding protein [Microbacterium rhizomatis]KAA9104985.1 ATP-binding cassette domain-containing protein [Microbacterium rhizomatis]